MMDKTDIKTEIKKQQKKKDWGRYQRKQDFYQMVQEQIIINANDI